jgi:hypothetical protein
LEEFGLESERMNLRLFTRVLVVLAIGLASYGVGVWQGQGGSLPDWWRHAVLERLAGSDAELDDDSVQEAVDAGISVDARGVSFEQVERLLNEGESRGVRDLGQGGESSIIDLKKRGSDRDLGARDLGPRRYLRVLRDRRREPQSLQTAIVDFRPTSQSRWRRALGADGVISLIGAVHIGEPSYYRELNREFERYDRVLYELVAPRGVRPKQTRGDERHSQASASPLTMIQSLLTNYLGMVHQIDEIDYSPRHFVHADLAFEDLVSAGKRQGETLFSFGAGVLGDMMRSYKQLKEMQDESAGEEEGASSGWGFGAGNAHGQKMTPRILLRQFAEVMERTGGQGLGPTLEGYIIDLRNDEALRVLEGELRRVGSKEVGGMEQSGFEGERTGGKRSLRLAIFYGAAHLAKMEQELRGRFGLVPVAERWVRAWRLE